MNRTNNFELFKNVCFIFGFPFSQNAAVLEARMPVERDAENYNMSHPRRGRAIIINNDMFDNNFVTPRTGSHVDVLKLENVFSDLEFEVTVFDNKTFQEIKKLIYEGTKLYCTFQRLIF